MPNKTKQQLNILEDASQILFKKLGPIKTMEFWKLFSNNTNDYLSIKKELFKKENVDRLYQKIKKEEAK